MRVCSNSYHFVTLEMGPAARIITSPYDVDARYSRKRGMSWTGYKIHVTETCEADLPHLVVEVMATEATQTDGETIEDIHDELVAHDLLPGRHLVDSG